jgi:hypothetical protein
MIAAREVQWLAVTYQGKLSEVNRLQRELFASMPRRLDTRHLARFRKTLIVHPARLVSSNPHFHLKRNRARN